VDKILIYSKEARERLKQGVDKVANMVKVTLGPGGHVVVLDRVFGYPAVTKDGVTVAKDVDVGDPVERLGVKLVQQVAQKTAEDAGDGTTTATLLTQMMLNEGLLMLNNEVNVVKLAEGIQRAVDEAIRFLGQKRVPIETLDQISQIATISSNNDAEIGNLIAKAYNEVGNDGVVSLDNSRTSETTVEINSGMQLDRGMASIHFADTPTSMKAELKDALVILYDGKLSDQRRLLDFFNPMMQQYPGVPVLLIADEFDTFVLQVLAANNVKGTVRILAVQTPGFGEYQDEVMNDIAAVAKAIPFSENAFRSFTYENAHCLGRVAKVTATKNETVIVGYSDNAERITTRAQEIKEQIENAPTQYDKQRIQERLARLTGGIAVIRVGGATEAEQKEKKDRVEDALHATRVAIRSGVLPGGGISYYRASEAVYRLMERNPDKYGTDVLNGMGIVARALKSPLKTILNNAGLNYETVVEKLNSTDLADTEKFSYGINVKTLQYGDLHKLGVIDPYEVVKSVIENAASVVKLLLITEGAVAMTEKDKKELIQDPKLH